MRQSLFKALEFQQLQQFRHARLDVSRLPLLYLQSEGHVLEHVHGVEERVVLEHEADVALLDLDVIHALTADVDVAFGRTFQTRDHAEHRGLAAAAGAKQRDQFAFVDGETHVTHRLHVAEMLADVLEYDAHEN